MFVRAVLFFSFHLFSFLFSFDGCMSHGKCFRYRHKAVWHTYYTPPSNTLAGAIPVVDTRFHHESIVTRAGAKHLE